MKLYEETTFKDGYSDALIAQPGGEMFAVQTRGFSGIGPSVFLDADTALRLYNLLGEWLDTQEGDEVL